METLWNSTNREADEFLVNNEILSDVKFVFPNCENKEIYGHKFLLSKKSPVFYTSFYGSIREGNKVEIIDSSDSSFLELLKYIYTEDVDLTEENVIEINYLANKYLMKLLQEKCENFIVRELSCANVVTILEDSINFKCEVIEKKCVGFIQHNTADIFDHANFQDTKLETVKYILALHKMNCKELIIFMLVFRWSKKYCSKNNMKLSSLRGLFDLVRFPTMTAEEFSECIKKCKDLLTVDEIGEIFRYISTTIDQGSDSGSEESSKCLNFNTKKRTMVQSAHHWHLRYYDDTSSSDDDANDNGDDDDNSDDDLASNEATFKNTWTRRMLNVVKFNKNK